MREFDDDLVRFEADETPPLPQSLEQGYVHNDGAEIFFSVYGSGAPVLLLHGGLGHSGNWSYQVPALLERGYQVILLDSRGHGRSSADERPYSYVTMATDVLAVLDHLKVQRATLIGWSDGATVGWSASVMAPERVSGLFFFGSHLTLNGAKEPFDRTPLVDRCFARHRKDYNALSPTPDMFQSFVERVSLMMRGGPNYTEEDLRSVSVPLAIVHAERDEFIKREHAQWLKGHIPNSELIVLSNVSHFAPLQRPAVFNEAMIAFVKRVSPQS